LIRHYASARFAVFDPVRSGKIDGNIAIIQNVSNVGATRCYTLTSIARDREMTLKSFDSNIRSAAKFAVGVPLIACDPPLVLLLSALGTHHHNNQP